MNPSKNGCRLLPFVMALLLMLSGCSAESEAPSASLEQSAQQATADATTTGRPTRAVTARVTLSDEGIQIEGIGAQAQGSTLTIAADGVYEIKGSLSDGQILVNAPDAAKVELLLAGVEITSSENAAIYCMNADDFVVSLADGTQNTLTDAANYTYADAVNEEPNAALFSKVDMNIGGGGSLTVNANFGHGISSKDDLVIEGGNFAIRAASHGIRGRDSLTILDGSFAIEAGGDGLQASNIERADCGWALLTGGQYTIQAAGDGIQAETALTIQGGNYDITTSGTPQNESTSQKGIKAGTILTVSDGEFKIDSIDDGVHSNVDVTIDGGNFLIGTGDDGIHADRNLAINGGTIGIPRCYEGFEGTTVVIAGGESFIRSDDDAISAAGGTDGTSVRPRADPNVYVRVTGGELEAVSGGDTIDANGYIFIDGGTLRLSSPPRPSYEGALLCNGDVTFTGGNVALVGNVGVGVIAESQPLLLVSHPIEQTAGSIVSIRDGDGNTLLEVESLSNFIQSAFTCPEFEIGNVYGIYIDGEKTTDITLSDTITKTADDGGEFTGGYSRGQW